MKLTMAISSTENSNLNIQIKNLNICTTHNKTNRKILRFSQCANFTIIIIFFPYWCLSYNKHFYLSCEFIIFNTRPPRGGLGAEDHLDSNIWNFGNLRLASITTLVCNFGGSGELISGCMAQVIVLSQWGRQHVKTLTLLATTWERRIVFAQKLDPSVGGEAL